MKHGTPTKKSLNFNKYKAHNLNLFKNNKYTGKDFKTCGSGALSLVTGINVKTVEKGCPNIKTGWYTSRAIKFLRSHGYTVRELTKSTVLNQYGLWNITEQHCLIVNSHVDKADNSMFVIHNGNIWHNFNCERMDPLFFVNHPFQDVLIVYHKKWKKKPNKMADYFNFA